MVYDGKKITFWREKRGLNPPELARRAGISAPSLWELENQVTQEPRASTLIAIASVLGVPLAAILPDKINKGDIPTTDTLAALFEALPDRDKLALVAAAEVMLKNAAPPPADAQ